MDMERIEEMFRIINNSTCQMNEKLDKLVQEMNRLKWKIRSDRAK